MILYGTRVDDVEHILGTSGFLYRSNKLMYDRATQSLWSTLWGKPVIGPLVGKNISLPPLSVVTTTWGEWRTRHPDTQVLSLDTGHARDYGEGVAYRVYFNTDEVMFPVPHTDNRLPNKKEVLALRLLGGPPLAINVDYLSENRISHFTVGAGQVVVITDGSGENRVYASEDYRFSRTANNEIVDQYGEVWHLSEQYLTHTNGQQLVRQPAHRAFWFGWRAAYPNTRLVE